MYVDNNKGKVDKGSEKRDSRENPNEVGPSVGPGVPPEKEGEQNDQDERDDDESDSASSLGKTESLGKRTDKLVDKLDKFAQKVRANKTPEKNYGDLMPKADRLVAAATNIREAFTNLPKV